MWRKIHAKWPRRNEKKSHAEGLQQDINQINVDNKVNYDAVQKIQQIVQKLERKHENH